MREVSFSDTRFIGRDLDRLIYAAVGKLADLKVKQAVRFEAYKDRMINDPEVHDLTAVERFIAPTPALWCRFMRPYMGYLGSFKNSFHGCASMVNSQR